MAHPFDGLSINGLSISGGFETKPEVRVPALFRRTTLDPRHLYAAREIISAFLLVRRSWAPQKILSWRNYQTAAQTSFVEAI